MFDHEKLDVYQRQLSFIAWVSPLLDEVSKAPSPARTREVRDQLNRASLSALLNLAEGNGKRQRATRAKFFDDARGSATECAACLDALVAQGVVTAERIRLGKELLDRVASMLTKLVARFDGTVPRDDSKMGGPDPENKRPRTSRGSRQPSPYIEDEVER